MQPVPVLRALVPASPPDLPPAFTSLDVAITGPVPFTVSLDATFRVTLAIPTGLGTTWRDAPATAVILDSADDASPFDLNADLPLLARVPGRLIVRNATGGAWSAPLVRGCRVACDGLEVVVLRYRIVAGSMREATTGSSMSLAWRRLGPGASTFTEPPLHPYVHARLPEEYRFLSWIGIPVASGDIPRRVPRPFVR